MNRMKKRMLRQVHPAMVFCAILSASQVCQAESVKLALDTGNTAHVVLPGQEDRVGVVLTNTADDKAEVTIHVEAESSDGLIAEAEARLSVPAQGMIRWPFPKHPFGGLGIKWVRFWANTWASAPWKK
jgi:hypothetical protein